MVALTDPTPDARPSWWWFIAEGVALLVLGVAGLYMTAAFTVASTLWYGVLLLIAGPAEIVEGGPDARERALALARGSDPGWSDPRTMPGVPKGLLV